eukprot:PhM_4_TR5895/c0_g4_i11/m.67466
MFFRLTLRESRKHGGRKQVRGCDCCHQRAFDVRVLQALDLRHEEIDGTITGVPAARVEALEQDAVCNRRRQRRESVEARFMRGGVLAEWRRDSPTPRTAKTNEAMSSFVSSADLLGRDQASGNMATGIKPFTNGATLRS